jgi:hypothetical protein
MRKIIKTCIILALLSIVGCSREGNNISNNSVLNAEREFRYEVEHASRSRADLYALYQDYMYTHHDGRVVLHGGIQPNHLKTTPNIYVEVRASTDSAIKPLAMELRMAGYVGKNSDRKFRSGGNYATDGGGDVSSIISSFGTTIHNVSYTAGPEHVIFDAYVPAQPRFVSGNDGASNPYRMIIKKSQPYEVRWAADPNNKLGIILLTVSSGFFTSNTDNHKKYEFSILTDDDGSFTLSSELLSHFYVGQELSFMLERKEYKAVPFTDRFGVKRDFQYVASLNVMANGEVIE